MFFFLVGFCFFFFVGFWWFFVLFWWFWVFFDGFGVFFGGFGVFFGVFLYDVCNKKPPKNKPGRVRVGLLGFTVFTEFFLQYTSCHFGA